jgi:putative secretion ATPase (PEP-CTERM system associated)
MYSDFYGLSAKPFQLTADHRFFFDSKAHHRAMAYLRYGLTQGEGFIVVTGGIGTGKTMLVRNLFGELDQARFVAAQLVTTQLEAEDMVRTVAASFGLAHAGQTKAALLASLESFFKARQAEGKRVLLVVDEAQGLPVRSLEELRMLSNFEHGGRPLLQSFLLGQDELKRTLRHPHMEQFRQRIIAAYHLRPLDRQETEEYIAHRLARVGWNGDPAVDETAFDRVFEFSGGTPRKINTLFDRVLLFGYLEGLHGLDAAAVGAVIDELREELWPETSGDGPISPSPGTVDLDDRLASLEREMLTLRRILAKDHRLLNQALKRAAGQRQGKD